MFLWLICLANLLTISETCHNLMIIFAFLVPFITSIAAGGRRCGSNCLRKPPRLSPSYFSLSPSNFLFAAWYFSFSAKKFFVTKFVTLVRKFVTHITKFVIHVTKFVINFFCADSENLQGGRKNYPRANENNSGIVWTALYDGLNDIIR